MKSFSLAAVVIAACAAIAPLSGEAQDNFPNRPIRLVVPFPPGGSVDPLARLVGQKLSESLAQPVVVDNRPGGNTVIGTEFVAKAPADGYTLLLTASSHLTNPQLLKTSYDPLKDFVPVATLGSSEMILVTNPSVQANTVQDLLALAKAQPGKLNFSSAGTGNPNHLAGELMNMMAGVKTTHVPYKGGAPAIMDLLGGQVQFSFGSPIIVLPHIREGKLKALAVTGLERMPALPQVPTMSEAGLKGYEMRFWFAVLAPAGAPGDVVAKLGNEIDRIMALPDIKEKLDAGGMVRYTVARDKFADVMRQDMEKFGRIIKTANVKLD